MATATASKPKNENVNIMDQVCAVPKDGDTFANRIRAFKGQQMAVIAVRYQYRGVLCELGEDYIALAQARAVEESGPASGTKPTVEDKIGSTIFIKNDALELFFQPTWAHFPLND